MIISKIAVLVAHEGEVDIERLQGVIETAIGNEYQGSIFEARHESTHDMALGAIVYAIEENESLADMVRKPNGEQVRG